MCGIAGFFINDKETSFSKLDSKLDSMLNSIKHRGPDDYGKYYLCNHTAPIDSERVKLESSKGNGKTLALGHRRLSILDTSSSGRQPLISNDGNLILIFNGEIYNYLELKQQIDYSWKTKTDSEVILAAYQKWGTEMLSKMDGMFSFIILDKNANRLFGARDVAGIKPFYYFQNAAKEFYFASEPNAIQEVLETKARFNPTYLSEFLLLGISDHDTGTMLDGISQLKGGNAFFLDLESGDFKTFAYHRIPTETRTIGKEEFIGNLKEAFKRQLRSDVPLGTSLSGGIDSSTIASLISTMLPEDHEYNALTFTSDNFKEDESELAKIVAKNAGLNWVGVKPSGQDLKDDIIAMIQNMGEPFSSLSMFAQYQVMKTANSLGIKVMLDGQGGDELYLGYPRLAMRVFAHYLGKGNVIQAYKELTGLQENLSIPIKNSILGTIYFGSKNIALKRKINGLEKYVDLSYLKNYREEVATDLFENKPILDKQKDEFYKYCLPRLLRYADRNSMAFAVESRVPHLSNLMIDLAMVMPVEQKVKNGWTKYILRSSMQDIVPDEILWSKVKRGFDIPQSYWVQQIRTELIEWVNNLGSDSPFKKEALLKDIDQKAGSTVLWPVLSTIALHNLNKIEF